MHAIFLNANGYVLNLTTTFRPYRALSMSFAANYLPQVCEAFAKKWLITLHWSTYLSGMKSLS